MSTYGPEPSPVTACHFFYLQTRTLPCHCMSLFLLTDQNPPLSLPVIVPTHRPEPSPITACHCSYSQTRTLPYQCLLLFLLTGQNPLLSLPVNVPFYRFFLFYHAYVSFYSTEPHHRVTNNSVSHRWSIGCSVCPYHHHSFSRMCLCETREGQS